MLLITKERFSEPTMFMKTNKLSEITHDIYDNKGNNSCRTLAWESTVRGRACAQGSRKPILTAAPQISPTREC